jgi:hypothetical protein
MRKGVKNKKVRKLNIVALLRILYNKNEPI